MIGKIPKTGRGFRGSYNYIMQGKKGQREAARVAWSETRNIPDHVHNIPALMRAVANQSQRCQKPVYHMIISWRPEENPSDDDMRAIAASTLEDMGLEDYQAVIAAHNDTDHRHLHILVNRVHPETGKAWHTSQDWARMEISIGRQAQMLGYEFVPGRHNAPERNQRMDRRPRDGEHQLAKKSGQSPAPGRWSPEALKVWREKLAPHFAEAGSWDELGRRLAQHDLRLEQKGQGLIIAGDHGHMKLSDLGKQVRLKTLEAGFNEPYTTYAERIMLEQIRQRRETAFRQRVQENARCAADATLAGPQQPPEMPSDKPADPVQATTAASGWSHQLRGKRHLRLQRKQRHVPLAGNATDEEADTNQQALLTDAQRQNVRAEARKLRTAAREAELAARPRRYRGSDTAQASDEDATHHDMAAKRRSTAVPQVNNQPSPQSKAFENLSEAYAQLDMAEHLHAMGLATDAEIARARAEVQSEQEELQKYETFSEFVGRGVREALSSPPETAKSKARHRKCGPEDEPDQEMER